MGFEMTIKVTGLEGLAEAVSRLADSMGGNDITTVRNAAVPEQQKSYGHQIAPHFPAANPGAAAAEVTPVPVQGGAPAPKVPVQNMVSPAVPQTTPSVPTSTRTYTLDELAGAAMTLMDRGMQIQLQELLAGYGVDALPMLPAEQYGNFATALRGMGAQI